MDDDDIDEEFHDLEAQLEEFQWWLTLFLRKYIKDLKTSLYCNFNRDQWWWLTCILFYYVIFQFMVILQFFMKNILLSYSPLK